MALAEKITGRIAFPWATLAIGLLAVAALVAGSLTEWLIFDRALILQGQVWRAWGGHAVHYGANHCLWNLAVFLPAGCWLERLWPGLTRWFYVVCPVAISAALLLFEPGLARYAGLSGMATGMLVLLAGLQLRRKDEPAWFWWGVLALVAAKIVLELFTGAALIVNYAGGVHSVPLAHIGGLGCGVLFWAIGGRKLRL